MGELVSLLRTKPFRCIADLRSAEPNADPSKTAVICTSSSFLSSKSLILTASSVQPIHHWLERRLHYSLFRALPCASPTDPKRLACLFEVGWYSSAKTSHCVQYDLCHGTNDPLFGTHTSRRCGNGHSCGQFESTRLFSWSSVASPSQCRCGDGRRFHVVRGVDDEAQVCPRSTE
eukprot:5949759-Amphidinium_carterae.2